MPFILFDHFPENVATVKPMDYRTTINLPNTDFPMKARLAELEPATHRRWDEKGLYAMIREARRQKRKYILHDGPPYPTGDLHIGTGLNKVLKDLIVRYKTMRGYDASFVPGWDCHGLPIEQQILQQLGDAREDTPRSEIRRLCREHALRFVEIQKRQFKSLGVSGDWDRPYLTLDTGYEAGILEVFAEMVGKGLIYRDLKPIHWCYHCHTALAEAELEYEDVESPSIYVSFPLESDVSGLFSLHDGDQVDVLIWTTTPWTLPANLAVAVHPQAEYTAVRYVHPATGACAVSILASVLCDAVMEMAGVKTCERIGEVKGHELLGLQYMHPFMDRTSPVVGAEYVTLQDGTGCVHTAPGHGLEDYQTGLANELEILSPVDAKGCFTEKAGPFAFQHITEGDRTIVAHLVEHGRMFYHSEESHPYPHCWRCHSPVIFRATNQWFVSMDHDGFRQQALRAIGGTKWIPRWGEERMAAMITERPDWCISRQRSWGVPIPAFYCRECGHVLLTPETVQHVAGLFAREGADSWFRDEDAARFLPEGVVCPGCGSADWEKETDIFDVWFESGSSHHSVCRKRPELGFPADLYLEGIDQYRGWFQLSLLPSLAAWGSAPYRTVLTHGFVVDEDGHKMSKSLGNFISVEDGVETFRAEILRLWVSSVDYSDQISVNREYILRNMVDVYRRIRNTFRFLLGNVSDFNPSAHSVPVAEMGEIDRWALDATARLVRTITDAFDHYEFHRAYSATHNFCVDELSSIYLDVLKDRLYCSAPEWRARRSAQTVLHKVLLAFCRLVAPILVHTADEVWSHIEHRDEDVPSVHLAHWPDPPEEWLDDELHGRWERILAVRDDVDQAIEALREQKLVAKSMEVCVALWSSNKSLTAILRGSSAALAELLIVSEIEILDEQPTEERRIAMTVGRKEPTLLIEARPSPHLKCARCWNLRPSVGQDKNCPDICDRCVQAVREVGPC